MSARLLLSRTLLRPQALGAGIGLTLGSALVLRQPKLRMDVREVPRASAPQFHERIDPELVKQISGGSVSGFLSGLLVSVFSKTLVLLLGTAVIALQVASRYGVDLIEQFKLKQRLGNSRVLAALERDPAFKVAFGFFFAMSAFMRF